MTSDRANDDMAPIYVVACKCSNTEDWLCYWPANVDATYRALLSYVSRFLKEHWANSIELIYLDGNSSMLRCTNIFGMPSKNDQVVTPADFTNTDES
ncbi:MAG: hypothetical protein ACOYD7_04095 [Raoultibacter sp.]